MREPTPPARAWPEVTPKVAIATAIASSKLFPAAVNVRRRGAGVAEAEEPPLLGGHGRPVEEAHASQDQKDRHPNLRVYSRRADGRWQGMKEAVPVAASLNRRNLDRSTHRHADRP